MPSRRITDRSPGFIAAIIILCCVMAGFLLTSCPPEVAAEKIVEVVK